MISRFHADTSAIGWEYGNFPVCGILFRFWFKVANFLQTIFGILSFAVLVRHIHGDPAMSTYVQLVLLSILVLVKNYHNY
jgi:hypothetical protein